MNTDDSGKQVLLFRKKVLGTFQEYLIKYVLKLAKYSCVCKRDPVWLKRESF